MELRSNVTIFITSGQAKSHTEAVANVVSLKGLKRRRNVPFCKNMTKVADINSDDYQHEEVITKIQSPVC